MKNKILIVLLLLLAVLLLAACKPDTPVDPDVPSTDDPAPDTPSDGAFPLASAADYTVVISEYADDSEKEAARIIRDAIEQTFGTRPKLGSDWIMGDVTDEEITARLEILVGDVDRPETKELKKDMTLNGYMICMEGNKLIILGANYEMTLSAAEYFVDQIVNASTTEIKADFIYTLSYDPMLVETVYDPDDLIVADAIVTEYPYLADPTGKVDATAAIQKALDDVFARGGGTVFIPAGDYLVTNSITIPQGCMLRGDWQDPDTAGELGYGTVLLVKTPELDEAYLADRSRNPLICVSSNSSVEGLTFYYPEQDIHNVKKYGYTIYNQASVTMTISNVTLINSYRGIGLGVHYEEVSELAEVSGVHMTALEMGYEHYHSSDVGYTTDVTISPRYWADAGRDFACSDADALRAYCKANTIAMQFNGLDDTHMSDLTIESAYTAIYMPRGYAGHYFWGLLYDVNIKDSVNGIVVEALNGWAGMAIAKAEIEAERAALYSAASSGSIKLCDVNAVSGDIVAVGAARIYEDSNIDLSEYSVVKATYEKPASYLYVAPVLSYSKTKQNVAAIIQETLDKAAATGGIVYIPAGVYSVYSTIEVPAGVELRGSAPFFMRDTTSVSDGILGTVLLTYVKEAETISLAEHAGVNGLRVFSAAISPKTAKTMVEENNPIVEQQAAIRGHGAGVYAHNVVIAGTFNGIDFTGCDNHSVKHAFGGVYRHFVLAGGKNGVIEQLLTNQTFYQRQQIIGTSLNDYKYGEQWGLSTEQVLTFRDELRRAYGITVYLIDAENENVSNVFTYGAYSLITTERSSATILNVSSDFHGMGPMFDIKDASDVFIANVLRSAGDSLRCDESSELRLINRTAVSWFNEPDFDSANGNEDKLDYTVTDQIMLNDGSTVVGETEAYVGEEFSKTDGTSLYHPASQSQDMTVPLYDQTFPAINLSDYATDDGFLHMWVYVEDMTTSVWTGTISLLNGGSGISWSNICFFTHNGWNELWLPMRGTSGLYSGTVNRLRITDNRSEMRIHSAFYFDDIYLCHANADGLPMTMASVSSYDVVPTPERTVAALPSNVMENGDIVVLTGDSLKGNAAKTNPARVMYEDEFVKEGSGSWFFRKMGALTLNIPFQSSNITYFEDEGYLHLWLYVERASTLSGTIELSSSATDNVQEISWRVSEYIKQDGWNELLLPLGKPSSTTTDMNWRNVCYFRMVLQDNGTIVVCVDDVRIIGEKLDAEPLPEGGSETFSFTVLQPEENERMIYNYSDIHTELTSRFMDNTKSVIYAYHVRDFASLTAVKWSAMVSGQLHLAVSTDGENWCDVYRYFGMVSDSGLKSEHRNFNLLDYIDNKNAERGDIYVKVADSYPTTGWGGQLSTAEPVEITFYYEEVDTSEWNCWDNGGEFKLPEVKDLPASETHTFKPGADTEAEYLKENAGMLQGGLRFADNNMHFTYGYPILTYGKVTEMTWTAHTRNDLKLQISQDGAEWKDVFVATDRLTPEMRTYDLMPYIEKLTLSTMLYIRISDATPEDGWGGAVACNMPVIFYVAYEGGEGDRTYPETAQKQLPALADHSFFPGTDMEALYLNANSSMCNGNVRYADNNMIFTYGYEILDWNRITELTWTATTSNDLCLQLSQDGSKWVDVYNDGERLSAAERTYDLLSLIDRQSYSEMLYIKISDSSPSDGWGGAVSCAEPVTLRIAYEGGEGTVYYPQ